VGKPAVPELVAELDRTDRDGTLRSLGFTLRAIGDPRAVPALIRAIPKALRPLGSDFGLGIADPELRAFMRAHQDYKDVQDEKGAQDNSVLCGRPVNEIMTALERITRHGEFSDATGKDVRRISLGGTPEEESRQRASFEQCRTRWEVWWSEHWREFSTAEELRAVELPKRDQDLVGMAGMARYGALFPTGPQVRLGSVHMLRLTTLEYANGNALLDFDTGRVFQRFEGLKLTDAFPSADVESRISAWYRQNGIDFQMQAPPQGFDLQLWLIDDRRWDTLAAEVRKNEPLPLGREAGLWYDELATFLFRTRQGGRGIVQIFPKDPDSDRRRLRYRMWLSENTEPKPRNVAEQTPAKPPRTPFGSVSTVALEIAADGAPSLLSLRSGRTSGPPNFFTRQAAANLPDLVRDERFIRWCREEGLDLLGHITSAEREAGIVIPGPVEKAAAPAPRSQSELLGLEMTVERITPESFDELTVQEARDISDRALNQRKHFPLLPFGTHLTERPDTFVFRNREGIVGLLQMQEDAKDPHKLTIRYRLEPRN
jgi:hypothetical protein